MTLLNGLRFTPARLLLLVSVILFHLILLEPPAFAGDEAVVNEAVVNLRASPGTSAEIVGKAVRGEKLEIYSRQGDWYKVKKAGLDGWVAGWLVTVSQPREQAVVKEATVNLRSAPNTSSQIVGKAVQGEKLAVLSRQGDWFQVKKGNLTCWVAGWLVDISRESASPMDPGPQAGGGTNGQGEEKISYRAEVAENGVNIRSGPGTGFNIIGQANGGNQYDVLDKSGGWYKIPLGSGSGWISEQFIKIISSTASRGSADRSPGESAKAVVKGSEVNIRSGPGTNYNVVSRVNQGDTLLLVDSARDWYKVKTDKGGFGWVVAWLVDVDRPQAGKGQNTATPPIDPPADDKTVEKGTGIVPPPWTPAPSQPPVQTPQPQKTAVGKLNSVSARTEGESTVITVLSDGSKINYSMTTVYDPDRLVVDISGLEPGQAADSSNLSSTLVAGVRVGLHSKEPCVTRVVIDLKKAAKYERSLSTDGTRLSIKVMTRSSRPLMGAKIVLDPGHGGSDPGAIGATGLTEKSVNLDIAQKAAQILRNQGVTVILTRTTDVYVDLYSRPEMASKNGADLFVSIHSNASPNRSASGTSTYFRRSDDGGMDQARFESMYLSRSIQSSLLSTLKRKDQRVLQADFVVVVKSKVPAALAEVAFISNTEEEKLLSDDSFRMKAAHAIAQGITRYLGAN